MEKIVPEKPALILLYGFPGSGKTYFSRQFCEEVKMAHLEEDRIRHQLFEQPKYSRQENFALSKITEFMIGEFLDAGVSVVYDANVMRTARRRTLREIAKKHAADILVVWFQVDADTAYARNVKRDRRRLDDRYAAGYNADDFKELAAHMQHPDASENFIVVSGKHTYETQRSAVIKKLADQHFIKPSLAMHKMVKPELVNLVPNGQKDISTDGRRTIILN